MVNGDELRITAGNSNAKSPTSPANTTAASRRLSKMSYESAELGDFIKFPKKAIDCCQAIQNFILHIKALAEPTSHSRYSSIDETISLSSLRISSAPGSPKKRDTKTISLVSAGLSAAVVEAPKSPIAQ